MQEAVTAGSTHQYSRATETLLAAEKIIITSPSAFDSYCVGLVEQLKSGREEVKTQEKFTTGGRSTLSTTSASHYQQRSTHASPYYSTRSKSSMHSCYKATESSSHTK